MSDRKQGEGSTAGDGDPAPPTGAVMVTLASLAITPDAALASFRKRRVPGTNLEVSDLSNARAVLGAIGSAVSHATPAGPELITRLRETLATVLQENADEAAALGGSAPPAIAQAEGAPVSTAPSPSGDQATPISRPDVLGPPVTPLEAQPPAMRPPLLTSSAPLAPTIGDEPAPVSSPAPLAALAPPPVTAVASGRAPFPPSPLAPTGAGDASPWIGAGVSSGAARSRSSAPPGALAFAPAPVAPAPVAASPVAPAPAGPPLVAVAAVASPPVAPAAVPPSRRGGGIDFAALNQVKVSESAPETMGLDGAFVLAPALPFRDADGDSPPPASQPASEPARDHASGLTISGGMMSPVRGATLPFGRGEPLSGALREQPPAAAGGEPPGSAAPASGPPGALPVPDGPPPRYAPASGHPPQAAPAVPEGAAGVASAAPREEAAPGAVSPQPSPVATPFRAARGAPDRGDERDAQVAAESARPAVPFRSLLPQAGGKPVHAPPESTLGLPPPAPVQPPPATPPVPSELQPRGASPEAAVPRPAEPAPQSLPDLSVEQCAALFAECATHQGTRAAIWARFGLDGERAFHALEVRWRERFSGNPKLFQHWGALYGHYCHWFASQGPNSGSSPSGRG